MKTPAPSDTDKKIVQETIEEFQESMNTITETKAHMHSGCVKVSLVNCRNAKSWGQDISEKEKKQVKETWLSNTTKRGA